MAKRARNPRPIVHVKRLMSTSALYHLYRLENVFNLLHDLWQAKTKNVQVDAERFRQASGAAIEITSPMDYFPPALEQVSRFCNETISAIENEALGERGDNDGVMAADTAVANARNLIIALDDLFKAAASRESFPNEYLTMQLELCRMAGVPVSTSHQELILACLEKGAALVTRALGSVQEAVAARADPNG